MRTKTLHDIFEIIHLSAYHTGSLKLFFPGKWSVCISVAVLYPLLHSILACGYSFNLPFTVLLWLLVFLTKMASVDIWRGSSNLLKDKYQTKTYWKSIGGFLKLGTRAEYQHKSPPHTWHPTPQLTPQPTLHPNPPHRAQATAPHRAQTLKVKPPDLCYFVTNFSSSQGHNPRRRLKAGYNLGIINRRGVRTEFT